MYRWNVGDEVWACYCSDLRYFPKLIGHVVGVGRVGFTVRLLKPDHAGSRKKKIPFGVEQVWPNEAEGLAWCDVRVGPYGPNEGMPERPMVTWPMSASLKEK